MVLRRRQLKPGATEFFVQTRYHRTAIERAVGYVDAGFAHSLQEHRDNSLAPEFSSIEPNWVIETTIREPICANTTSGRRTAESISCLTCLKASRSHGTQGPFQST